MELRRVIDEIARQADDFLAGAADRREARAGIAELINADFPGLAPPDRDKVATAVMAILEDEGFFAANRADAGRPDRGSRGDDDS